MNKNNVYAFLLVTLLVVVSCGKDSDKPLSNEQRGAVKELSSSTSSVLNSGKEAQTNRRGVVQSTSPKSQNNQKIVEKISSSDCTFSMPSWVKSNSDSMDFSISGEKCPIVMVMNIKQQSSQEAQFRVFFKVKDKELADLVDVIQYELAGPVSATSASLYGSIISKKYGEVKVEMKAAQENNKTTVTLVYKFSDFEANLKVEATPEGTKYFVNNEEVTESEFTETAGGSAGLPGTSGAVKVQNKVSSESYSYELSYNGCSTGKQQFSSKAALCEGLQSYKLNQGCAENLRRDYFKSYSCPGVFTKE